MNQSSPSALSYPQKQPINAHLAMMLLVFVLLISLVFSVIYLRQQQADVQSGGQLTQLSQQINYQQALIKTSKLLEKILTDKQADKFQQDNQQLIEQWLLLNTMLVNKSVQFELWLTNNQKSQDVLAKIVNRSEHNTQLLAETLEQLQLIINTLNQNIDKKNRQLQQLHQLVLQDNVNDSVTVNRAKAHTKASTELESLKALKQEFSSILNGFQQLTIKTASDDYEQLNQQITKTFALHEFLKSEINGASLMFEVDEKIAVLQLLLLTEQRTVAKWRGHLRLIHDYRTRLQGQYQALTDIIINQPLDKNVYMVEASEQGASSGGLLSKINQVLSTQQQVITFWLIFTLLSSLLVYLLIQIQKKYNAMQSDHVRPNTDDDSALSSDVELEQMDEPLLEQNAEKSAKKSTEKISAAGQSEKLKQSINALESELIEQNKASQIAEKERNNKLNEMLIQAMVDSHEGSAATSPKSSLPQVYRQLSHMLDWLRQKQVVSHLQISAKALSLSDVNLIDEIHAAILNAMSEAQYQQNQILLNCDPKLITTANLDARLFQRLIRGICQLTLIGQKQVLLQLSLKVIDKNAGQQIVKVIAEVTTQTKVKALPKSLALLIANNEQLPNDNDNDNDNDSVSYVQALIQSQHASNVNGQITEQGYELSLELPLTIVDKKVAEPAKVNLKKASVLLITANENLSQMVAGYIRAGDGIIRSTSSSTFFIDDLTLDELTRRPLKIVIVADDCYQADFEKVQQHIAALPQEFQPKLMVMQSIYQVDLAQQGSYAQVNCPLSQQQFLTQLNDLILSEKINNLLIDSQEFQPQQYRTTQVEVLLAVNSPEQHLPLLTMLNWLGLQVKVVAQAQAMKKHWQTGRYLVLLNQFGQSPFIEMTAGKSAQRGVFSFSVIKKDNLSTQQLALAENWQLGQLPATPDLSALASLLAPWLKTKTVTEPKVLTPNNDIDKVNSVKAKMANVVKDKKLAAIDKKQTCFDMAQYTKHQGTSELAIYMLDEYMESNDESFNELSRAIKAKDSSAAEQALMVLVQNARILAADDLIALCLQLEKTIAEQAFDKASEVLLVTKKELTAIKKYASTV